jgi:hypothetical protein
MKYRELLNIVNKDLQLPAILAINSSINAEESLSRVFEVLQGFLDADGAFVNIYPETPDRFCCSLPSGRCFVNARFPCSA